MKFCSCIAFMLLVCLNLQAQVWQSPHQRALIQHKHAPVHPSLLAKAGEAPIALAKRAQQSALQRDVFGYLPYWQSADNIRFELISHLACFSVEVNANGSLGNLRGWPWTGLINFAHQKGVKVILVATLFDPEAINTLISNPNNKQRFFSNIREQMLRGKADGVNIDFEGPNSSGWHGRINGFMQELTEYLHQEIPGSEVSIAAPAVNWGNSWDFAGLANSCDYIFVMGYAFAGSWSTTSGPNAPLSGGSINITNTVDVQYGSVTRSQPEKLILGVPYYGNHWKTAGESPGSSIRAHQGSVLFSTAESNSQTWGRRWHTASQTPWYAWQDGGEWHQVWFDDDSSLGLKYDLALERDYRGIGMWALDYDGQRDELWQLLDTKVGSGNAAPPSTPLALQVRCSDATSLDISWTPASGATGYFIYTSEDGQSFSDSVFAPAARTQLRDLQNNTLYYLRVAAVNASGISKPTQLLAAVTHASPSEMLIVQGFDRTSNTVNPGNYVVQHADALHSQGIYFDSATNEAVQRDSVSLNTYRMVDWILGDESTADETFNSIEREYVMSFLQNGGALFVSGAEIGWDLDSRGSASDRAFYQDYLKAKYVDDAPRGQPRTYYQIEGVDDNLFEGVPVTNFDDGSQGTFDVDWPDAIAPNNGSQACLSYVGVNAASGVAGVSYSGTFPGGSTPGKLVHLAVPFETIYPASRREQFMRRILDYFNGISTALQAPVTATLPQTLELTGNYPNPFNPETVIGLHTPAAGDAILTIFDATGRMVWQERRQLSAPGLQQWRWQGRSMGGTELASGTYFYRVRLQAPDGRSWMQKSRMALIR